MGYASRREFMSLIAGLGVFSGCVEESSCDGYRDEEYLKVYEDIPDISDYWSNYAKLRYKDEEMGIGINDVGFSGEKAEIELYLDDDRQSEEIAEDETIRFIERELSLEAEEIQAEENPYVKFELPPGAEVLPLNRRSFERCLGN